MTEKRTQKLRYTICVSGAAAGETVSDDINLAERLGRAVAKAGHVLSTGATIGLPYAAAKGAYQAGGLSIGFSPAASLREHVKKYRLPIDQFDFINFTGMSYVGRDLYLVQSSDVVLSVGGRFGSLHEFTSALEAGTPCGILLGSGGTADVIPQLMELLEPPHQALVFFDTSPEKLVERAIAILDKDSADLKRDLDDFSRHNLERFSQRRG